MRPELNCCSYIAGPMSVISIVVISAVILSFTVTAEQQNTTIGTDSATTSGGSSSSSIISLLRYEAPSDCQWWIRDASSSASSNNNAAVMVNQKKNKNTAQMDRSLLVVLSWKWLRLNHFVAYLRFSYLKINKLNNGKTTATRYKSFSVMQLKECGFAV